MPDNAVVVLLDRLFTAWDCQRGHESDPWRTRAEKKAAERLREALRLVEAPDDHFARLGLS